MRIMMQNYGFVDEELYESIKVLKHALSYYLLENMKLKEILTVVLIDGEIASELIFCKNGRIESDHIDDLEDFCDWIDMRVRGVEGVPEVFKLVDNNARLHLVYSFDQIEGSYEFLRSKAVPEIVEIGEEVESAIVHLGIKVGTFCPDCGVSIGNLHVLGCRFEQCKTCKRLLASCLCGSGAQILKGWVKTKDGYIPGEKARIPYGSEDYPIDILAMLGELCKSNR